MSKEYIEDVIDNILSVKNKKNLKKALYEPYYNEGSKCDKTCSKGIKILILNAPCNGFGDLIFALKLSEYLKKWYGGTVTLVTTLEKGLLSLGADPKYVAGLVGGVNMQCRKFRSLKINRSLPKQDLILVAPVQMDFDGDIKDVKRIIPYANELNTFFFSEYNDSTNKNFTFHTGIGKSRDGLLLTDVPKKFNSKPSGLTNPYSIVYVAGTLSGVDKCILAFVEMVAKKYHNKYKNLDIVIPDWFTSEDLDRQLKKKVSRYYPNIVIKKKDGSNIIVSEGSYDDNTLTFRCDVLPVPNKMMIHLMNKSIEDILLTGDQSITDALSCCPDKNIFYQIAPWKSDLAKNLAKEMPNINLKKVSTSCGSLKAISYKSNYGKFVNKWDFRKLAKPLLDAIILSIVTMKKNDEVLELAELILHTRSLKTLKNKVMDLDYRPSYSLKSSRRKSSRRKSRRKSIRSSKKRCKYGIKKDGYCKKKPTSSRRKSSRKSRRKSNRRKSSRKSRRSKKKCKYGIKKDGYCKKKYELKNN